MSGERALSGVKVVEFARYIAGPYCGMILADLGADVLKVESPAGDPARLEGPWVEGESAYFGQMNRNKRGETIDTRSEEGVARLTDLVRDCDVFIENFRPGVLEKMGLGPERIEEINPRCVVIRISGFGQDSPLKDRAAFDCILQASSGLAWMSGRPEDEAPLLVGSYVVDITSGLCAALAGLAALQQRERTGLGQIADATMLDAALMLLGYTPSEVLASDRDPRRWGNTDATSVPANAYRAKDGWVYIHAGPDHFWRITLEIAGREEVLEDERLRTFDSRLEHRELADAVVADWVRDLTVADVVAALGDAGVPVARINTVKEALADPELRIEERIADVPLPGGGTMRTLKAPVRLSRSPIEIERGLPGQQR